jgi:hypothetical protein
MVADAEHWVVRIDLVVTATGETHRRPSYAPLVPLPKP